MYFEFVILAQILPMANLPPGIDLDKHNYKDNEVLIFTLLYNTQNGLYRGHTKKMGYITLRGDANESFYSYGFDKQNSKVLFCTTKQPLPNIFQCPAFKKHSAFVMSQNQENLNSSKMFMFLPSTLDRKEFIQQYNSYVNLHPVHVSYEQLKVLNNNKNFDPSDLDKSALRKDVKIFYTIMKEVTGVSNHNLIRNSNAYLPQGGKIDPEFEFSWIDHSYQEAQQKFQLGY